MDDKFVVKIFGEELLVNNKCYEYKIQFKVLTALSEKEIKHLSKIVTEALFNIQKKDLNADDKSK